MGQLLSGLVDRDVHDVPSSNVSETAAVERRNPFGKDAFMVPALRHFDTGSALHTHCCKGDLVLKT